MRHCSEADVISRQQAREVAEQACDARGFPFEEPVKVSWGLFNFRVRTKADHIGGNVVITVSARTGEVKRVWVGLR